MDERLLYQETLSRSHRIYVRAAVLDRNERFSHWIAQPVLDGQVDTDTKQTPEQSLDLVLADPQDRLALDDTWADNFIQVHYGIFVDGLARIVWHPVFTGPITKLSRDSSQVTIQAASKDSLLIEPVVWGHYIRSAGLSGGNRIVAYTLRTGRDHAGTHPASNAVQQIIALGPVEAGGWKVVFDGKVTTSLNWNASASDVETALEALPNIAPGDVNVTGGPLNSKPFTVTFTGGLAHTSVAGFEIRDGTSSFEDDIRFAARFLRVLLRETGESQFGFGFFARKRLPKNFKLPKAPESVWSVAKKVVAAVNEQSHIHWRLYYDGAGVLRVENMDHGFTFDERILLNAPTTAFDLSRFRNTTIVAVNRGNEARPVAPVITTLPKRRSLSPHNLRRNGKKRYLVQRIENSNIRTPAQARRNGQAQLNRLSAENVDVAFDCLPVPIVVPGSKSTIVVDGEVRTFHLETFSIPLGASDSMSVGYHKRMTTKRRRPLHA